MFKLFMKAEEIIHVIFVANVLLRLNISKFTLRMNRVAEKMVVKHFCYNLIRNIQKILTKINNSIYSSQHWTRWASQTKISTIRRTYIFWSSMSPWYLGYARKNIKFQKKKNYFLEIYLYTHVFWPIFWNEFSIFCKVDKKIYIQNFRP